MTVRNLFNDEDYAKQFEKTAKRFGKGEKFDERKYCLIKLSCARKDNVTPRRARDIAEEVAEAFFRNYECMAQRRRTSVIRGRKLLAKNG